MDSNNIADKLKAMLDDPATLNTLSAILGSMQQSPSPVSEESVPSEEPETTLNQTVPQAEAISRIKQALEQTNVANDPRITLLNSLRPYMRKSRLTKMDQAIRIIQISKMATLFKP